MPCSLSETLSYSWYASSGFSQTHFCSLLILIGSKMRSQSFFLYHHLPQTPLHPAQRIQILRPPSYTSPSRPKMPPSFTTSSVKASSNPLCRNDYVSALLGSEFVSNDMSRTEFLIVVQIQWIGRWATLVRDWLAVTCSPITSNALAPVFLRILSSQKSIRKARNGGS